MSAHLSTISIITATWNCRATVADCLASVAGQTWPHRQHVVVDGASTDGTLAVLQKVAQSDVDKDVKELACSRAAIIKGFADFILSWQVSPVYSKQGAQGKDLFDVPFAPEEKTGESVGWAIMPAGEMKDRPWQLDLGKLYGGNHRVAYARTWIYAGAAQAARVEAGSDDGVKIWLNGEVIISSNQGGDVVPGAFKAPVQLKAGWNSVLVKVVQWTSGWGFCFRVASTDGGNLPGVRVSNVEPDTH